MSSNFGLGFGRWDRQTAHHLSNANPNQNIAINLFIRGLKAGQVSGQVLQGDAMNAHNTFAQPNRVAPKAFTGATQNADGLAVTLPEGYSSGHADGGGIGQRQEIGKNEGGDC